MPECPLTSATVENASNERKFSVAVAEPVAVCHEKLFAFERENLWFAVYYQSDFLFEVAECPEVVVADEEVDGNAGFGYFAQFAEQPCKAFWHDGGVFEPKIEDIAEQKDSGGIGLGHVEPIDQSLFVCVWVVDDACT